MSHQTNIREFKKGLSCGSDLVESYCALIAIELKLYSIHPLRSHNIIDKIQNLLSLNRANSGHAALSSALAEYRRVIEKISVAHTSGLRTLNNCQYPTMRYTRYKDDWPQDFTDAKDVKELNIATKKIIFSLKGIGQAL